jgi:hypothetical protein
MATLLIRSALTRGLSRSAAVEVTKSVLSALDLPAYSWAQEQALYDDLKSACLLHPLAALAKTLKAEDVRTGGATAGVVGPPRGRVAKGNPAAGFDPGTIRALTLLKDVAKEARRKPASVKPVAKAASRRTFLVSKSGIQRIDPSTSGGHINLFK